MPPTENKQDTHASGMTSAYASIIKVRTRKLHRERLQHKMPNQELSLTAHVATYNDVCLPAFAFAFAFASTCTTRIIKMKGLELLRVASIWRTSGGAPKSTQLVRIGLGDATTVGNLYAKKYVALHAGGRSTRAALPGSFTLLFMLRCAQLLMVLLHSQRYNSNSNKNLCVDLPNPAGQK